jgi:pseudaminic acid synthase
MMNKIFDKNNSSSVYIIAELSANHEQNLNKALEAVRAIKETGADAIKVQTFKPESITLDSDQPWFRTREDSLWAGQKLVDLYKKAALPYEWHKPLQEEAHALGLDFFSSPFDFEAVDFLEELNVLAYKIASLEITHIPLIEYVAAKMKPVIISTGVASEEDIALALDACRRMGNEQIVLLKCTSAYPTPPEESNLAAIQTLKNRFNTIVGLSDHSLGIEVPILSVALGAKLIEKHFILDKANSTSVDKDFSLDKEEFTRMVAAIRIAEKAMGNGSLELTSKMKTARTSARSLFVVQDIKKGELFTQKNIKILRPGKGLHPKHLSIIIGKKALRDIEKGTPLTRDYFE